MIVEVIKFVTKFELKLLLRFLLKVSGENHTTTLTNFFDTCKIKCKVSTLEIKSSKKQVIKWLSEDIKTLRSDKVISGMLQSIIIILWILVKNW